MSASNTQHSGIRRLWTTLRSRRLAVWLLVGLTVYLAASTVLDLPRLYSNPLFLLVTALLTISTAACAWERTGAAVRNVRRERSADITRDIQALRTPTFSINLHKTLPAEEARTVVRDALRTCGLRTYEREQLIGGDTHSLGNWGSPLFHWGLVGLFLFAGLGQLTRSEGLMNVVVGSALSDVAASYVDGPPSAALFFGRYTHAMIGVEKIDLAHFANGSARGASPLVTIADGGTMRVRQWVYPNAPARYGSLTIHRQDEGPAVMVSITFPGGHETTSVAAFFPTDGKSSADPRATIGVENAITEEGYTVEFQPKKGKRVVVSIPGTAFKSVALSADDKTRLPDGTVLKVDALTSYAQLRVINDWTLPYVFGAFCLTLLGIALSVFLPPRRVVAAFDVTGLRLDVRVGQRKNDPAFALHVERALHAGVLAASDSEDSK